MGYDRVQSRVYSSVTYTDIFQYGLKEKKHEKPDSGQPNS